MFAFTCFLWVMVANAHSARNRIEHILLLIGGYHDGGSIIANGGYDNGRGRLSMNL